MSASSKKKLRREQVAAKKAELQQTELKEAKRTKLYTRIFCGILALMILLVAVVAVNNSGLIEPNVTALTVGDTKIPASELNMYYITAVNEFIQANSSYLMFMNLNTGLPLDTQMSYYDPQSSWASYFTNGAIDDLHYNYAVRLAAEDAGFTLSEETIEAMESPMEMMEASVIESGLSFNEYLKKLYGKCVTKETYRQVLETTTIANEYHNFYTSQLTYSADDIAAYDAEDPSRNNLYSYAVYYMYASDFLEGGTIDENGKIVYSDEEVAASVKACEEAAKALAAGNYDTVEKLEKAIALLPISKNENVSSTLVKNDDVRSSTILASMADWVTAAERQIGDITYVEQQSTINGETSINGYNVVLLTGRNDNNYALANVRHILVSFEGGTTDPNTGAKTYSEAEIAAAKQKAQDIYDAWVVGGATEESFAELAMEKSTDPGSNTTGGLYADVYPGQMVPAFNDWCFDESRVAGDHGIVQTDYGFHIMFYSGDSETTYRDYLITNDLRAADLEAWYAEILEKYPVVERNLSRVDKDLILSNYLYYGY